MGEEAGWAWWASADEELYRVGPCATRQQAIDEAIRDEIGLVDLRDPHSFHIVEARTDPLKLSDWLPLEDLLDRADDAVADSDAVNYDFDEPPYFDTTRDQEADLIERLKRAADEWQEAHGLVFKVNTFTAQRNAETITVTSPHGEET